MRLNSLILSLTVVGSLAMPLLCAGPAQAQRTWVSGVGDDANPCSRTAPCKTWAGAISKTAAGSEIDALDPGGFGALTITKSITIDGGGGQVASTLVGNSNGFVVQAASNDIVVIRNVRFQGNYGNGTPASPGLSGIVFNAGKAMIVDNCDITGFSVNGITVAASGGYAAINNTRIENVANIGISAADGSNSTVEIDNSRVYFAKNGVLAGTGTKVTLSRSVVSDSSSNGILVDASGNLFVDNSVVSFNATGIFVGGGASVALANSDFTFNTAHTGGGTNATSYTNNRFFPAGGTVSPIGGTTNPTGQQ